MTKNTKVLLNTTVMATCFVLWPWMNYQGFLEWFIHLWFFVNVYSTELTVASIFVCAINHYINTENNYQSCRNYNVQILCLICCRCTVPTRAPVLSYIPWRLYYPYVVLFKPVTMPLLHHTANNSGTNWHSNILYNPHSRTYLVRS